jgi:nucleoside-diphosphate-sugar epimerase
MRVVAFVTGATGFLGRRIVDRLLARGDEVRVLVRDAAKAAEQEARGARPIVGDLADVDAFREALSGCDVVYHAGARVLTYGDWEEFLEANVIATQKLIDYSLAAGAKRFVHVSSLGIFEIPADGITIDEETDYDHQPLLRGYYTRSKIDADRVARAAAAVGKPVVVVRPGQLYGPGAPAPLYMGRVSKRLGPLLLVVSTPGYYAPVVYVENAADAVVRAGTADGVEGRAFNVVDDTTLQQREYFEELSKFQGYPRTVVYLPVSLFLVPVLAVNALYKLLKRRAWAAAYQLRRSGRNARYATDAVRESLGWQPRIDWRDAVRETIASA